MSCTLFCTYGANLYVLSEGLDNPAVFHLDFEAAAIKAVKTLYPNTDISCCDTHWKNV